MNNRNPNAVSPSSGKKFNGKYAAPKGMPIIMPKIVATKIAGIWLRMFEYKYESPPDLWNIEFESDWSIINSSSPTSLLSPCKELFMLECLDSISTSKYLFGLSSLLTEFKRAFPPFLKRSEADLASLTRRRLLCALRSCWRLSREAFGVSNGSFSRCIGIGVGVGV